MEKVHVDTLWEATIALVVTLFEHGVLYLILFYAIFKTATSMENNEEASRWLKYWICYGVISFFCSYVAHGALIKSILCGVLLLKFNNFIILNSLYDVVLTKVLDSSRAHFESSLQTVVYNLFKIVEFLHWSVISTFGQSESVTSDSQEATRQASYESLVRTRQVIETELRKSVIQNLEQSANRVKSKPRPGKNTDDEAAYERLSKSCVLPASITMDEPSFHASDSLRRRR